jgi:hypothetical protein
MPERIAMTLADWTEIAGILPTTPTTECGAVSLVIDDFHPCFRDLWKLADYRLDSTYRRRDIVIVWLLPRR